jgi:hypothetical protein
VAGSGSNTSDIGVAYVGWTTHNSVAKKAVFYTHTINGGDGWSTPFELSDEDADSSGCPSLAKVNQRNDLAVAYISWTTEDEEVIGRVWCQPSDNAGASWGTPKDPSEGISDRPHARFLSASASPCADQPSRFFEVVWEEPYLVWTAASESICNQPFYVDGDEMHKYNSGNFSIVNSGLRPDLNPRTPSVYSTVESHNAGCAWVHGATPYDTVYTNWRQGRRLGWDGTPAIVLNPAQPAYNHGFPTIACLDTASNMSGTERVSHELVACDATDGPNSTDRALVLSFRDWGNDDQDRWRPGDWYSEWYDLPSAQLLRPNL